MVLAKYLHNKTKHNKWNEHFCLYFNFFLFLLCLHLEKNLIFFVWSGNEKKLKTAWSSLLLLVIQNIFIPHQAIWHTHTDRQTNIHIYFIPSKRRRGRKWNYVYIYVMLFQQCNPEKVLILKCVCVPFPFLPSITKKKKKKHILHRKTHIPSEQIIEKKTISIFKFKKSCKK